MLFSSPFFFSQKEEGSFYLISAYFYFLLKKDTYDTMISTMKVNERRSHGRTSGEEEKVIMTRKQKAESNEQDAEQSPKKSKTDQDDDGQPNGKSAADVAAEFEEFCKAIRDHLSIQQMREILEANGQDTSGPDGAIISKWLVFKMLET
jgi:hypothetical protein